MKKITLLFVFIGLLYGCSGDDDGNLKPGDQYFDTIADEYGIYFKTTEPVTVHYQAYSYNNGPDKIFREGDIEVTGEELLSFPITSVEIEALTDDDGVVGRYLQIELEIIEGSEDNFKAYWFAKNEENEYLVFTHNRNKEATSAYEENPFRSGTDNTNPKLFVEAFNIKGSKGSDEWINEY